MKGKAGRKLKAGNRYPSGQLRPAGRDHGCDGVIRRLAIYAPNDKPANDDAKDKSGGRNTPDTFDAIGRAYLAGLLDGQPVPAETIRDAGRDFAALYWRIYGVRHPQSQLGRFLPQGVGMGTPGAEKALEGALNRKIEALGHKGRIVRNAFDALCVDSLEFDSGPPWLDRLIFAKRKGDDPMIADARLFDHAMKGLLAIC